MKLLLNAVVIFLRFFLNYCFGLTKAKKKKPTDKCNLHFYSLLTSFGFFGLTKKKIYVLLNFLFRTKQNLMLFTLKTGAYGKLQWAELQIHLINLCRFSNTKEFTFCNCRHFVHSSYCFFLLITKKQRKKLTNSNMTKHEIWLSKQCNWH